MPPSYSPCPRPCLKRSVVPRPLPQDEPSTLLAIDPSILSPMVRFPPQPSLAHTLGNALPYDRSPIVVVPNNCALPERGCPGRTYAPDESARFRRTKRSSLSPTGGKHLHPRAVTDDYSLDNDLTPRQSPRGDNHLLPPLVPDLSSESSEESDSFSSTPPELYHAPSPYGKMSLEHSLMNLSLAGTNAPSTSALSFLPHPPSPRVRPHHASLSVSPVHPPSNPQYLAPSNCRTASPVRSRSPSSPTHSRRKSRPQPIPVPASIPASYSYPASSPTPTYIPMSPSAAMGVPASPERERRSRHRDDRERREHRDRSRERKEQERAARLARYKTLTESRLDDAGCLGGF
ncbi:hypothetical protein GSI_07768 [Ganoderma sinense ZZ0214-1]|uniref:Uncharacterized protein n=1 Tax=Ganoderma sinense ZZ0214-1 TaxID=1077348 RepID=A0A2G8S8I5_9APHY|nr:hypothetical protein GSI_07667 [Ganoderma sinense ZZ0214-1]PIL30190.1 hypothetical protein GSI_07768 [Ganoderma sinense ZZ0214-1]